MVTKIFYRRQENFNLTIYAELESQWDLWLTSLREKKLQIRSKLNQRFFLKKRDSREIRYLRKKISSEEIIP